MRFKVPASAMRRPEADRYSNRGFLLFLRESRTRRMPRAWPSFSVYPHLSAASGARAITVPLNDRDEHDLDVAHGAQPLLTTNRSAAAVRGAG